MPNTPNTLVVGKTDGGFRDHVYRDARGRYLDAYVLASNGVLATPSGVTVVPQGTTGATTYGYRISAKNGTGETLASTTVTTATGNATLSVSNFNRISWSAVTGASSYRVFGRTSGTELFIVEVTATTFDDTGAITPAGALPGSNTTSTSYNLRVPAYRVQKPAIRNPDGTSQAAVTTTFPGGVLTGIAPGTTKTQVNCVFPAVLRK